MTLTHKPFCKRNVRVFEHYFSRPFVVSGACIDDYKREMADPSCGNNHSCREIGHLLSLRKDNGPVNNGYGVRTRTYFDDAVD